MDKFVFSSIVVWITSVIIMAEAGFFTDYEQFEPNSRTMSFGDHFSSHQQSSIFDGFGDNDNYGGHPLTRPTDNEDIRNGFIFRNIFRRRGKKKNQEKKLPATKDDDQDSSNKDLVTADDKDIVVRKKDRSVVTTKRGFQGTCPPDEQELADMNAKFVQTGLPFEAYYCAKRREIKLRNRIRPNTLKEPDNILKNPFDKKGIDHKDDD